MGSNTEFKITEVQTHQSSSEDLIVSSGIQPDRRKRNSSVGIDGFGEACQSLVTPYGHNQCQFQLVRRSIQTLHPHPALARLNLVHSIVELNKTIRVTSAQISQPIQITSCGTIVTGYREWHTAVREGRKVVDCIESSLSEEQALESILIHDQRHRAWNSFNRVCIALELKPYFQARALAHQHAGGKYKGLANLPKAEHIDVREKIGALADVSGRTVSNVETILRKAAPRIIEALQSGTSSINRALEACTLPRSKQIDDFTERQTARVCDKIIREAVARCAKPAAYSSAEAVLEALRHCEAREPGSVSMRISKRKKTVILLGKDFQSSEPLLPR